MSIDHSNNTPLHYAAEAGHTKLAALLTQYGADIEVTNNYKLTPFGTAIQRHQYSLARELIRRGAHLPDDLTGLSNAQITELKHIKVDRLCAIKDYYSTSEETAGLPKALIGLLLTFHGAERGDIVALGLSY